MYIFLKIRVLARAPSDPLNYSNSQKPLRMLAIDVLKISYDYKDVYTIFYNKKNPLKNDFKMAYFIYNNDYHLNYYYQTIFYLLEQIRCSQ